MIETNSKDIRNFAVYLPRLGLVHSVSAVHLPILDVIDSKVTGYLSSQGDSTE